MLINLLPNPTLALFAFDPSSFVSPSPFLPDVDALSSESGAWPALDAPSPEALEV